MPLNKQDLKSIREVFEETFEEKFSSSFDKAFDRKFPTAFDKAFDRKFPTAFEEAMNPFATAIQNDISKLGSRLEEVEKRLTDRLIKLEDDTSYLRNNAKFIEERIDELKEELKKKPDKEIFR